jgi:hypothetical protein
MAKKSKTSKIDIQAIGLGLLGAVAAGKVAKLEYTRTRKSKTLSSSSGRSAFNDD